MTKYFYDVDTIDLEDIKEEDFEGFYEFESSNHNLESIAEDASEDYYDNHDGLEVFVDEDDEQIIHLFSDEKKYLGSFKCYIRFRNYFTADKIER